MAQHYGNNLRLTLNLRHLIFYGMCYVQTIFACSTSFCQSKINVLCFHIQSTVELKNMDYLQGIHLTVYGVPNTSVTYHFSSLSSSLDQNRTNNNVVPKLRDLVQIKMKGIIHWYFNFTLLMP